MTPWRRIQGRAAPAFLLPAMVLLGLFAVLPALLAAWWSLTHADLLAPGRAALAGFANYSSLVADPRFRRAFANTALFAVLVVPVQTAAAFLLALLVNRPEPAWRWLRVAFFVPVVMSMPVLAVLWTLIYQPAHGGEAGLLNAALRLVGIGPRDWLHDPSLALPSIAAMSVWQGVGLQMMVFLAGLQSVPRELLDAARIDGAGRAGTVLHVVLPSLRNTVGFVVTVTTILAFRLFVQPYLMTHGGPGNATVSIVEQIYDLTFVNQDLGHACAGAVLFLGWVGLLTLLLRLVLREERS